MTEEPRAESFDGIDISLKLLEITLVIARQVPDVKRLERESLKQLEEWIQRIYGWLEIATYQAKIADIKDERYKDHPLVSLWNRWEAASLKLTGITDDFLGTEGTS